MAGYFGLKTRCVKNDTGAPYILGVDGMKSIEIRKTPQCMLSPDPSKDTSFMLYFLIFFN